MDGSYPGRLRPADRPAPAVQGPAEAGESRGERDVARQLYASEAFNPGRPWPGPTARPSRTRSSGSWTSRATGTAGKAAGSALLEFSKHAGETLLGMGRGLGTDWLQYARHGASVVACSPSPSQLALIAQLRAARPARPVSPRRPDRPAPGNRQHRCRLPHRPAPGRRGSPCLSSTRSTASSSRGKVLVVAPARYDVDFGGVCFWWRLLDRRRRGPVGEARFSARACAVCSAASWNISAHRRQLRRGEVPHLWCALPMPMLERLLGHVLVLKAFKPLSAAIPSQAVADGTAFAAIYLMAASGGGRGTRACPVEIRRLFLGRGCIQLAERSIKEVQGRATRARPPELRPSRYASQLAQGEVSRERRVPGPEGEPGGRQLDERLCRAVKPRPGPSS